MASRPSAPLIERERRLPIAHRRIQCRVLGCCKIRVGSRPARRTLPWPSGRAEIAPARAPPVSGQPRRPVEPRQRQSLGPERSTATTPAEVAFRAPDSERYSRLPVPISATRPVRTRCSSRSTSPSVSGRGIERAERSLRSDRCRKPDQPGDVGEGLARASARDGALEARHCLRLAGSLPCRGTRRAASASSAQMPQRLAAGSASRLRARRAVPAFASSVLEGAGGLRHRSAPAGSPSAAHRPAHRGFRSARRSGCGPRG